MTEASETGPLRCQRFQQRAPAFGTVRYVNDLADDA